MQSLSSASCRRNILGRRTNLYGFRAAIEGVLQKMISLAMRQLGVEEYIVKLVHCSWNIREFAELCSG